MTERRKIRWLIAHFPQQLFIRTAKAFAHELEKICPNQFEIEILTMDQYVDKYDKLHEFKIVPPAIAGLDGKKETRDDYTETDTWKDATVKWKILFEALGNGVEIVAINDQDRVELQQAAAKVYEQLESLEIDPVLVQAIVAQGHNQVH